MLLEPTLNLVLSFLTSWIIKAAFFYYYLSKGFTSHAAKLFYATSLNSSAHVAGITMSFKWSFFFFLGDIDVTTTKLYPWNIVCHSSFRGGGVGGCWLGPFWLSIATGSRTHLAWPATSERHTHTWNTPQEIWQPRVICGCFTFQTLSLGTGTPAASRMPSHLAFFKSNLARALFDR